MTDQNAAIAERDAAIDRLVEALKWYTEQPRDDGGRVAYLAIAKADAIKR